MANSRRQQPHSSGPNRIITSREQSAAGDISSTPRTSKNNRRHGRIQHGSSNRCRRNGRTRRGSPSQSAASSVRISLNFYCFTCRPHSVPHIISSIFTAPQIPHFTNAYRMMMDNFKVKLKNLTTTLSMTTNLTNQILMQPQKSDLRWHRCAIAARGR